MRSLRLARRGIPEDSEVRRDGGQLQEYLRGEQHGDTVFPGWSANEDTLAVPSVEVRRPASAPPAALPAARISAAASAALPIKTGACRSRQAPADWHLAPHLWI